MLVMSKFPISEFQPTASKGGRFSFGIYLSTRVSTMSTLNDARMSNLADKHFEQEANAAEAQADATEAEEKRGKGRIKKSKTKK